MREIDRPTVFRPTACTLHFKMIAFCRASAMLMCDLVNNNNNAICIAQIRRKQQMGCGQCPKRKVIDIVIGSVSVCPSVTRCN